LCACLGFKVICKFSIRKRRIVTEHLGERKPAIGSFA
jgi:hypothetical protein